MQWVDNVRSLYQFNEDLCLQQLDSEVPLRGWRLSGLHSVAQGVRVGSYRSCQWLANEVTRWTGSVQCRKGVVRTGWSPSFILCLGDVIWCLHILFLLFSIETRSWDKKTRITFQLGGVSVAVIRVKPCGGWRWHWNLSQRGSLENFSIFPRQQQEKMLCLLLA